MGLDALLATMESRAAVTLVTPNYPEGVTAKPLPIKACTPVTPVTPKVDNTSSDAPDVDSCASATPATIEAAKGRADAAVAIANPQKSETRTQRNRAADSTHQRVLEKRLPSNLAAEVFAFSPPGDPGNDDEALQERVAIMMEANGWDAARALREARWQADRERCWQAFLRNAKRVLNAL